MSIESKVFEKLFSADKVELASQKIELGTIDTIIKEQGKAYDTFYAAVVLINNARVKAEDLLKTAILFANNNLDSINKSEIMAKELGIDLPKNVLDAKISGNNILKKSQSGLQMLKSIDL
jgi:hypothetical protein